MQIVFGGFLLKRIHNRQDCIEINETPNLTQIDSPTISIFL
jgi:hypothetical protein